MTTVERSWQEGRLDTEPRAVEKLVPVYGVEVKLHPVQQPSEQSMLFGCSKVIDWLSGPWVVMPDPKCCAQADRCAGDGLETSQAKRIKASHQRDWHYHCDGTGELNKVMHV